MSKSVRQNTFFLISGLCQWLLVFFYFILFVLFYNKESHRKIWVMRMECLWRAFMLQWKKNSFREFILGTRRHTRNTMQQKNYHTYYLLVCGSHIVTDNLKGFAVIMVVKNHVHLWECFQNDLADLRWINWMWMAPGS